MRAGPISRRVNKEEREAIRSDKPEGKLDKPPPRGRGGGELAQQRGNGGGVLVRCLVGG